MSEIVPIDEFEKSDLEEQKKILIDMIEQVPDELLPELLNEMKNMLNEE